MPDKKGWKRSDSSKGDGRKITGHSGPGRFAGATGERPSRTGRRCGKEVSNSQVSPHVTRVPKV